MLIFLDIDGVMVPAKGWKVPELLDDGFPVFSSKATSVLQKLISLSATVILTTSHKSNYSVDEWKNIFRNRQIYIDNLKCLPNNINNLNRKEEIEHWLNNNHIDDDFIIIDDDKSLNSLSDEWKQNLVQTSPYIGLTEEHLELVKHIMLGHRPQVA
jgi:hypothetical protein